MLTAQPTTQRIQALALLQRRGMARLAEFNTAGITAATVGRMERAGTSCASHGACTNGPTPPLMPSSRWRKWPDWCPRA